VLTDDSAEVKFDDEDVASPAPAGSGSGADVDIPAEVARRRNFAIISHPDAGKTTLTEKLLLYGGAIQEAGAVKARRAAKHATSDWMEMEKARGISITSTAMQFEYQGFMINLLDTPGHADFSEDTYRTLAAADNALMLIDAAKGLEPQTRKLFAVCRLNGLPVFTFVNKLDRPGLEPLEIIDQVEAEFNLPCYPVNWPIGSGDRFRGVYNRPTKEVYLFEKTGEKGRAKGAVASVVPWGDPSLEELIEADLFHTLQEEIELLEALGAELDMDAVRDGKLTPVYFGSGMNNFGVELFLQSFLGYAVTPRAHESMGNTIQPDDEDFSGFVFKLQANMDPKHRDRVAFLRVCSGKFERGMKVKVLRTGKNLTLSRPQKMFAQDREVVDDGFAGDVIGLNNPGAFAIGDTVYAGKKVGFPGIPMFSPELFCYLRNPNPSKYKQFTKGLDELLGEGAVQVLYQKDFGGRSDPILAAVGQLQFEVVQGRMETEYGVETVLEPLPYQVARWVEGGWDSVEAAGKLFNAAVVQDLYNRPVLLFRNTWNLDQLIADVPKIGKLLPYALPPALDETSGKRGKSGK